MRITIAVSFRPSTHLSFHLYAWHSAYLHDTWYWEVVKEAIEPCHYLTVIWKIWQTLRMKSGCISARISKYTNILIISREKRKKLLLFYSALKRLFFILMHCFNKGWHLNFKYLCFADIFSIFCILERHQNLECCVKRGKVFTTTSLISVWIQIITITTHPALQSLCLHFSQGSGGTVIL